jgi:hypothetical protein
MSEQQYAWTHLEGEKAPSGRHLMTGDTVYSFRGEEWTFESVSRGAYGSSSGRVAVSRPCPDAYDTSGGGRECVHMWHRYGIDRAEYFPSVFGLYLGDAEGNEA